LTQILLIPLKQKAALRLVGVRLWDQLSLVQPLVLLVRRQ
jgi:hypothetical protein